MISSPGFDLAVALLFAAPGPTNALIAVAAARRGAGALPALVGAALAGFLLVVGALVGFFGPVVASTPAFGLALRIVCALLLARSAWRLWRKAGDRIGSREAATASDILAVTLANPKCLIFAFAIFPPLADATEALQAFARFSFLGVAVMSLWGLAGAAVGRGATRRIGAKIVDRAGAAVLAAFSVIVVVMRLAV